MCNADHIISTLHMEYNATRQEIRDLVNSMSKNRGTGVTIISSIIALTAFLGYETILYLIPSVMFFSITIHLILTSSLNIQGAYCQVVQDLLKEKLGHSNAILDWEGGFFTAYMSRPYGLVQTGFYLVFAPVFAAFCYITWHAYLWHGWTLAVHVGEFLAVSIYGFLAVSWNTPAKRERIIKRYWEEHKRKPGRSGTRGREKRRS
jgi:hypothetical protein